MEKLVKFSGIIHVYKTAFTQLKYKYLKNVLNLWLSKDF